MKLHSLNVGKKLYSLCRYCSSCIRPVKVENVMDMRAFKLE